MYLSRTTLLAVNNEDTDTEQHNAKGSSSFTIFTKAPLGGLPTQVSIKQVKLHGHSKGLISHKARLRYIYFLPYLFYVNLG